MICRIHRSLVVLSIFWGLAVALHLHGAEPNTFAVDLDITGDLTDTLTFGMDPSATAGIDIGFDAPYPPGSPGSSRVSFVGVSPFPNLATDIRGENIDGDVWELSVVLLLGRQVTLSWTDSLPSYLSDKALLFINPATGSRLNMKVMSETTLITSGTYLVVVATGGNHEPTPAADSLSVSGHGSDPHPALLHILDNDTDPDGDGLIITAVESPTSSGAIVRIVDGGLALRYTPAAGAFGDDVFTYEVTDNHPVPLAATATVTATVREGARAIRSHAAAIETGDTMTVSLDVSHPGTLSSLELRETLPSVGAGGTGEWTYVPGSVSPGAGVTVSQSGRDLLFDFGSGVPASPFTLSYRVMAPANDSGAREFSGDVVFTFDAGGPVFSDQIRATSVQLMANVPDWAPPAPMANTMTVHAIVALPGRAGMIQTPGSKLAVFDGATLRGVADIHDGPAPTMQFQLMVQSDAMNEAGLRLLIYDSAADATYAVEETVNFSAGTVLGLPTTPITYTALPPGEGPATVSITDAEVTEGDTGSRPMRFSLSLSEAYPLPVTVEYTTADDTASSADDYDARSGQITFSPGATLQRISVPVNGDTVSEGDETFTVALSNPLNASLGTAEATGTIRDDEAPLPSISVNDVSLEEGHFGQRDLTFTVTLDAAPTLPVTVDYATSDQSATLTDNDYVGTSGTLTFTVGETSRDMAIPVNGDTTYEADETIALDLSNPTNATLADAQGIGTIENDDQPPTPTLTVTDAQTDEGDAGSTPLAFQVQLDAASTATVTVDYATMAGTATVADGDYVAVNGQLTFAPGETDKTITVDVSGDSDAEADEQFVLSLSAPVQAMLGDAHGVGTIRNDDSPSTGGGVPDWEPPPGLLNTMTVHAAVRLPGGDLVSQAGSMLAAFKDGNIRGVADIITGPAGQQFQLSVGSNATSEPGFTLKLYDAATGNTHEVSETIDFAADTTLGLIFDPEEFTAEAPAGALTLTIGNAAAAEGDAGTTDLLFSVHLSETSPDTVTVDYTTVDVSATVADADYLGAAGTLTFDPGEISRDIHVTINGDTVAEDDEFFFVALSNPVNAGLAGDTGMGTIENDDMAVVPLMVIGDAEVSEGDAGTATLRFMVQLDAVSDDTVSVDYSTGDGSATTADNDYAATTGTLTFAPGETGKMISVHVNGDNDLEDDETLILDLSNPIHAVLVDSRGTGTILNDDTAPPPALSIGNAEAPEGNSGTTTIDFMVSLSEASPETVSVNYSTADHTATTADDDYQATGGTVTFTPGETSRSISVVVNGDRDVEANETFTVSLTNPTHATFGTAVGTGTILNDDSATPPSISIGDAVAAEGDTGAKEIFFTVALSEASGADVSVDFNTRDSTATVADNDYEAASGTLTFAPGETSKTIAVQIEGDTRVESDELFTVTLTNPLNGVFTDPQATGWIQDDDARVIPELSIGDAGAAEGNAGTTVLEFPVHLITASTAAVTVDFHTRDTTAVAADGDYEEATGTLTFTPGETEQAVAVTINGDADVEPDELFSVTLTNSVNAIFTDPQATGTIEDDDATGGGPPDWEPPPGLLNSMTVHAVVQLPERAFVTEPGSMLAAFAGEDIRGVVPIYTGPAGQQFQLSIGSNATSEPGLTMKVYDAASGQVHDIAETIDFVADDTLGLIFDPLVLTAQSGGSLPALTITDAQREEGDDGVADMLFTVQLSAESTDTVLVDYATRDDTATTADNDYEIAAGQLAFTPGETLRTISVPINGDGVVEPGELFTLTLTNPVHAVLADPQATGWILNDDAAVVPTLAISDVQGPEGDAGTTSFNFTVELSEPAAETVRVDYATDDDTATVGGNDYVATSGLLTFSPGETNKTIVVSVNGDATAEPDELFTVTLSNLQNARFSDPQATGWIRNDDPPAVSIGDIQAEEGDLGPTWLAFAVSLSSSTTSPVTVNYATADGSATTMDNDYQETLGQLTFSPGQMLRTVVVPVNGDNTFESDETFSVVLSHPVNATLGDAEAVGTILNDDVEVTEPDGLEDDWERLYFGNLDQGPLDDPDGDRSTNWEEYRLRTDPTDHTDVTDGWLWTISLAGAPQEWLAFGMDSRATDGWDSDLDQEGPTGVPTGTAYAAIENDTLTYQQDVRGLTDLTTWLLVVGPNSTQPLELTWQQPGTFPGAADLLIQEVDEQGRVLPQGLSADMRRYTALTIPAGADERFFVVTYYGPGAAWELALDAGWNLISLPVQPATTDLDVLFDDSGLKGAGGHSLMDGLRGTIHVGTVWTWDGTAQTYAEATELHALQGAWVYVEDPVVLELIGTAVGVRQAGTLPRGWNLIGLPTGEPAPSGRPLRGNVWGWETETWTYEKATGMVPLDGYWLNLDSPTDAETLWPVAP